MVLFCFYECNLEFILVEYEQNLIMKHFQHIQQLTKLNEDLRLQNNSDVNSYDTSITIKAVQKSTIMSR